MAHQFRFVAVAGPTASQSSESRREAQSHVMRRVHASKRQLQMQLHSQCLHAGPPRQVLRTNKDPFAALARPLPDEEFFLLDHYKHIVVPSSLGHCSLFSRAPRLLDEWISLALTDAALMAAVVRLGTCRHMLRRRPDHPVLARLALQHRHACLRALRRDIADGSSRPVAASTVAKALALAIDEVLVGEHGNARTHLHGVTAMIRNQPGGGPVPAPAAMAGVLGRMYDRFVVALEL